MTLSPMARREFFLPPFYGAAEAGVSGYMCSYSSITVRAAQGRLSGLIVSHNKSVFNGAFVWARRALNSRKRRFPARAGAAHDQGLDDAPEVQPAPDAALRA